MLASTAQANYKGLVITMHFSVYTDKLTLSLLTLDGSITHEMR